MDVVMCSDQWGAEEEADGLRLRAEGSGLRAVELGLSGGLSHQHAIRTMKPAGLPVHKAGK